MCADSLQTNRVNCLPDANLKNVWTICPKISPKEHPTSTTRNFDQNDLNSTETFKTPSFVWKVLLANTLDNYYFSILLVWTHWQHIDCQWWSSQPSREKYSLKLCVFLLCSGHAFVKANCCELFLDLEVLGLLFFQATVTAWCFTYFSATSLENVRF